MKLLEALNVRRITNVHFGIRFRGPPENNVCDGFRRMYLDAFLTEEPKRVAAATFATTIGLNQSRDGHCFQTSPNCDEYLAN